MFEMKLRQKKKGERPLRLEKVFFIFFSHP